MIRSRDLRAKVEPKIIIILSSQNHFGINHSALLVYQTHCQGVVWWIGGRVFFVFDPLTDQVPEVESITVEQA
jgi:hypothetical protein